MGWFGPKSGTCSCCEDDCSLCDHCVDESIDDPLSSYVSSCSLPSSDWVTDIFVDDWGDGELEIVCGHITATVKPVTISGTSCWRVDFPDAQNPLDEGCEGPTTCNDAASVGGIVIRIAFRTQSVVRGIECESTQIHASTTISLMTGDPCSTSQFPSSVCQSTVFESMPSGSSIELTASGTGTVVSKIRVMNRVVDNIPCIETNECQPCVISSFDIAHWKDLSVSITGLPSGAYSESWVERNGYHHQCYDVEFPTNRDFYCAPDWKLSTREVLGLDGLNATYNAKLIDLLDETLTEIPLIDAPDGLLDTTSSTCRDRRYAWMTEVPVAACIVVDRIQWTRCLGSPNSEIDIDETTVHVGYLRIGVRSPRHVSFFKVDQFKVEGQEAYDQVISDGPDITWNVESDPDWTGEPVPIKFFDTTGGTGSFDTGRGLSPFYYGPWDSLSTTGTKTDGALELSPGDQIDDVGHSTAFMPVISPVSKDAEPNRYVPPNGVAAWDLGRCDGEYAIITNAWWWDIDFTRAFPEYHRISTAPGFCPEGENSIEILRDAFLFSTNRSADYDLEGNCCEVEVNCCPNALPCTLFASVFSSECGCFDFTVELTWDGSAWVGSATVCGAEMTVTLSCSGSTWVINLDGCLESSTDHSSAACDPVEITFVTGGVSFSGCCGGSTAGYEITVVE